MGLVTDAAGASFASVGNVHVMQVAFAIAKLGIDGCFGEAEQIFFVTGKAGAVDALLVWGIELGGIVPPQHPEVIRTMRVMACRTFSLFDRAMEIFFTIQILFDVSQRRSTQVILVVATQAGGQLIERQETLVPGIVGRVA